jgi:hypothetical protein
MRRRKKKRRRPIKRARRRTSSSTVMWCLPPKVASFSFSYAKEERGKKKKIEGHVIIAKVARTLNDDGRTNQSIGESSAILFITGGVAIYYLFIYIYIHTHTASIYAMCNTIILITGSETRGTPERRKVVERRTRRRKALRH